MTLETFKKRICIRHRYWIFKKHTGLFEGAARVNTELDKSFGGGIDVGDRNVMTNTISMEKAWSLGPCSGHAGLGPFW